MDKVVAKKILVEISESLFELPNHIYQDDILNHIQKDLQRKYKQLYLNLNLSPSNNLTDVEVVNSIAKRSEKKNEDAPQIARQLPKFNQLYSEAGFECTLATAVLRFALADAGYQTNSLLLRTHFAAMRELDDSSTKIYDAATRITVNGQIHGFLETFSPSEIFNKKEVLFDGTKKGFVFTIKTRREIQNTEMFSQKVKGLYTKQFFAYEPDILVDLAVVLENLSQFR